MQQGVGDISLRGFIHPVDNMVFRYHGILSVLQLQAPLGCHKQCHSGLAFQMNGCLTLLHTGWQKNLPVTWLARPRSLRDLAALISEIQYMWHGSLSGVKLSSKFSTANQRKLCASAGVQEEGRSKDWHSCGFWSVWLITLSEVFQSSETARNVTSSQDWVAGWG